ncbi:hypothetical protein B5X24_HaOG202990 [Helicoverpa armigera]|uniref:Uncharacterized protein n=1 Tax=Helicoverpa armigera TaxID=29058 RepID=A0A2W1BYA4_HELAM|nr:uncharacterized protein LOC110376469 [Helicoverpa armigera]PZC77800.1 hypothetical protein B5X24_HaOG202990 [Helicoverpa armigera]
MEITNSKTSQKHGSGDDQNKQSDEQPTTSREDDFTPEQNSHNMNDFNALDFNSADEIRQTMKAVLTGKLPPQSFSEEANHFQAVKRNPEPNVKINENNSTADGHKTVQRQVQQNLYQKMKSTARAWTYKAQRFGTSRLKKTGRPPTAGPSKTIRKPKLSSMYLGKLANVVPFTRRRHGSSESDVESVVIFY